MPEANALQVAKYAGWYREGSPDTELGNRALDISGARAERKARREITDTEYDDIVSKKTGTKSAEYADLQEAEALLVAYWALKSLNLRITKKGGLQRRTGTVDNENDLMSYSEMDAYRQGWFDDAMDILDDLAPTDTEEAESVYAL